MLKKYFSKMGDEDISICLDEIKELETTTILPDGKVREIAKDIGNIFNIPYNNSLTITKSSIKNLAAYKWNSIYKLNKWKQNK